MHTSDLLPAAPPSPCVSSLDRLRAVQLEMAGLVEGPLPTTDVTLSAIAGRVLAEPLHRLDDSSSAKGEPILAPGTLLRPAHVPVLASPGRTTVRVFERPRVGIMALGGGGRAPPAGGDSASTTATMLSSVIEQMGAKAFVSSCDTSDACHLLSSLKALLSAGCSLVLIVGAIDGEMREALERSGALREATNLSDLELEPFGSVQLARACKAHLVALPTDPETAYATFIALVSPLVRALSGRSESTSPTSTALLIDDRTGHRPGPGPFWVHEQPALSRCGAARVLRRTDDGLAAIADATGLAWCPSDLGCVLPGAVAYIPL
jgi:molybdopterin molybdotransferase